MTTSKISHHDSITTHLHNANVPPETSNPLINKYTVYAQTLFPLIGALSCKVGIPLRLATDILTLNQTKTAGALLNSAFSTAAASSLFFAPSYFRWIEAIRSLTLHVQDVYLAIQTARHNPEQTHKIKALQKCLHLFIDIANLSILSQSTLERQLASHLLQAVAGLFDFKEQLDKNSYVGMAAHLGLTLLRFCNLSLVGQKLYQERFPKTLEPTRSPLVMTPCVARQDMSSAAPLSKNGTGISELNKLTVLQYLGQDDLSGDLFLVRDENGETKILKRLFSETDKMARSLSYTIAHGILFTLFSPFYILGAALGIDLKSYDAEQALKVSDVGDSNILKVFKIIQNQYTEPFTNSQGETTDRTVKDTYLLTEQCDWKSLKDLTTASVSHLGFLRKISETLANIAHKINHFYSNTDISKIKFSEDTIKISALESFSQPIDIISCLHVYDSLYTFFEKLINLLPNKEIWIEKLNTIFNLRVISKIYLTSNDNPYKEELIEKYKHEFTIDRLKDLLDELKALFAKSE